MVAQSKFNCTLNSKWVNDDHITFVIYIDHFNTFVIEVTHHNICLWFLKHDNQFREDGMESVITTTEFYNNLLLATTIAHVPIQFVM